MRNMKHNGTPPVILVAALGAAAASAAAGGRYGLLVFLVTIAATPLMRWLGRRPLLPWGLPQTALAAALAGLIPMGPVSFFGRLLIWGSMLMMVLTRRPGRLFVPGVGLAVLAGHSVARDPATGTYILFVGTLLLLMGVAVSLRFPLRRGRAWVTAPLVSMTWLLLMGVPVAAFAYVVFPRWQTHSGRVSYEGRGRPGGGSGPGLFAELQGGGEGMLPMVDLRYGHEMLLSPKPVFYAVVRTEGGGMPPPGDMYWRLDAHAEYSRGEWKEETRFWALDDTRDGAADGWVRLSDAQSTIQSAVYPARGKVFDRLVTVYPAVAVQLPVVEINREGGLRPTGSSPRPLVSLSGPQRQYWDMALGAKADHADPRYTDVSSVPGALVHIARSVVGDELTPSGRIRALREYLISRCRFSYRFASTGRIDPVEEFVLRRRQGSCSCFASALTLMLRAVGVPSRIATGYTGGFYDSERGLLVVRECDAHAWVEVYFEGIGWLPVEATPATTAEAFVEGTADPGGAGISLYDRVSSFWSIRVLGYSRSSQRELFRDTGLALSRWLRKRGEWFSEHAVSVIGLASLVAAVLFLSRYFLRLISYTKELQKDAPGGMRRLLRSLGRMGLRRRSSETWLEFADTLKRQASDLPDLNHTFRLYSALRYGGRDVQDALEAELERVLSCLPRVWYPT